MAGVWSESKAKKWQREQGWLVGCNYIPRNAINAIEMWQADTFSPDVIRQELGWAKSLGFNTVRVFLHDLAYAQDPKGFIKRLDRVLGIAAKAGIGLMPVFFDSVWHPFPRAGRQPDPEPGVHNSGWVQSPGLTILRDEARFNQLEEYVTTVVRHFAKDERVQIWDVWNEPENTNPPSYGSREWQEKPAAVAKLLPRVFEWARKAKPSQPLTAGIWTGEWTTHESLRPCEVVEIEQSDIVSFHWYGTPETMQERITQLSRYGRPMLCTEYMARVTGNTFQAILPMLKQHNVGAYNWGFVAGKSQTNYPWDSWQKPYEQEPNPWFHDIFRPDGSAYIEEEVSTIRSLTGVKAKKAK